MGLSKHNRGRGINWGVETKGWGFKKLSELEQNKVYPLKGLFQTSDNGFGVGVALISDGFLVSIPGRFIDDMNDIINDEESVAEIKSGRGAFSYHMYKSERFKRDCYAIEWITLNN